MISTEIYFTNYAATSPSRGGETEYKRLRSGRFVGVLDKFVIIPQAEAEV